MKPGTYTDMGASLVYINDITITADLNTVDIDLSAYTGAMFRVDGDYTIENVKFSNYSTGNNSASSTASLLGHYQYDITGVIRRVKFASPRLSCRLGYNRGGLIATNYSIYERGRLNLTMDRCQVYDMQQYGAANGVGYAFSLYDSDITFTNNTFHFGAATGTDSAMSGLFNYNNDTSGTFKNNIFMNASGATVDFARGTTWQVAYFDYNDVYLISANTPTGTGNITDDPLFVDPTTANFDLQPTSPCIDAGVIL